MSNLNDSNPSGAGQPGEVPTPIGNTGVVDILFRFSLDWLRWSVPQMELDRIMPEHPAFAVMDEKISPLPYYNAAVALECGRIDWHTEKPQQKMLVTLDGQAIQAAVVAGVDLEKVLSHALYENFGKITRLDFAVDVFGASVAPGGLPDPMQLKALYDAGLLETVARSCGDVGMVGPNGVNLGRTVYIGSRDSGRVVRVYDKGRKEGIDTPWLRVEIEFKGDYAQAVAKSMLLGGIIPAGKAALRDFVDTNMLPWWVESMHPDNAEYLEPVQKRETDRQRWYRNQIFPALVKDMQGGDEQLKIFLRMGLLAFFDLQEEQERHGGVEIPELRDLSHKWRKALKALACEGMDGGLFSLAFRAAGTDAIESLLNKLGYAWNTKKQDWILD